MPLPTKENVARPASFGYDALVEYGDDSLYLRLAAGTGRRIQIDTAPIEDAKVSTDENPEDMRPESGQAFSRSDWSGGEGLARAHRRDGAKSDFTRYWASEGVDVSPTLPGAPARVTLLGATESLAAASIKAVVEAEGVLFHTNGTNVVVGTDPTSTSPTFTTEDPHASQPAVTVEDLTALGTIVYAALGTSGIHRRTATATWSHWSDVEAVRVWSVKGRILASDSDNLYEAKTGATSTLLHTLAEGRQWTDVADAGEAILATATDGYVYSFQADNAGALALIGQTPVANEQPLSVAQKSGVVLVGTGQPTSQGGQIGRLWRFSMSEGVLSGGQVLHQWGDGGASLNHGPTRMFATRDNIFAAHVDTDGVVKLWRFHLSTGGLSSDLVFTDGAPVGVAEVDGRLAVGVSDDGLWIESSGYVEEGWLISPAADFYTAALKQWVGARLATPANIDGEVLLEYSTELDALTEPEHPSWRVAVKATAQNPGEGIEQILRNVTGRYLIFKLTLRANAAGTGAPVVDSVAFRALADPEEIIVTLPVNVSDQMELPGRRRIRAKGTGDRVWQALKDIEGEDATVTLLRPYDRLFGQVLAVSTPIDELPARGSATVYCQLTIRGRRTDPSVTLTGPTWGVPMWGSTAFGGTLNV